MSLFSNRSPFAVALAYLIPLLFWSLFILPHIPETFGFWTLALGWLTMSIGTLFVYLVQRQNQPQENVSTIDPEPITRKEEEDYHYFQKKAEELSHELNNARAQGLKLIQEKELTISDLQMELGLKKEELDLAYEKMSRFYQEIGELIKNSREVKVPPSHPSAILARCLEIAGQHTGAWSFSTDTKEVNPDSYALDQSRLYQALGKEQRGVVFLYSPKEERVLYVNQASKNLLGIAPDIFAKEFQGMIAQESAEWKKAMNFLTEKERVEVKLPLQAPGSAGQTLFSCEAARITKGLFKNKVIAVLTP